MFAFVKNLLGLESESESSDSDSEFSSINSSDYENDSDNESVQEEEVGEDQADFQRGDRCSFCPRGQKKWSNAVVIKYRYPNQFTLKIEGSGRICLGIKREQLHLPIKVIPINTSITYKVGEMVDVVRKKTVRTVDDARKELEKELNEVKKQKKGSANNGFGNGNGNVHFNNDAWTQGQIVKVTNDAIDPLAPPWYKIRFEGGIVDHKTHSVEIRCRPSKLPDHVEVDVKDLGVGDAIHISELPAIEGVEYLGNPIQVIVSIQAPTVAVATDDAVEEVAADEVPASKVSADDAE